jgi:biopolymer transport protein ExbB
MYPIFLCSVIGVAVIVERWVHLQKATKGMSGLAQTVRNALMTGDMPTALATCRSHSQQPLSRVLLSGLSRASQGEESVRRAIGDAGSAETERLERHMTLLATIVGGAPLLGFLGTVLGMIEAFQQIEQLGGNVDASVLAGGIWQALLTTAAGLSVGVVAYFAYNFLQGKIRSVVSVMEESSERAIHALFVDGVSRGTRRASEGDDRPLREGAGA